MVNGFLREARPKSRFAEDRGISASPPKQMDARAARSTVYLVFRGGIASLGQI